MILSGYSDLESLTNDINHRWITKFINKPRDDFQLWEIIQDALKINKKQQQFQ